MQANEETQGNSNASQQIPPPPLPPTIERNEDSVCGTYGSKCNEIQHTKDKPEQWLRYLEAFCAVLLVGITFYYTRAAFRQAQASEVAAKAAKDAADTATESLKLTRDAFNASQAAVLQPNISIRDVGKGPFIQIDIVNRGSIAATRVDGEIIVTHHAPLHLANVTVTNHSASPEYPSGFITRTVGLSTPLDMQVLAKQHIRVKLTFQYWNGINHITSRFCYGLTVSPYTGAQDWQDCENQETLQQKLQ